MDAAEYRSRTEALFNDWELKLRTDIQLAKDGAVDPECYFKSTPRILFILKEMNASPWIADDLCEYLTESNTRAQTWNNVLRWRKGLRDVWAGKHPDDIRYSDFDHINTADRKENLKDIAAINLKKVPGSSSSNMLDINSHAEHFKELLSEQVELLDPEVIVACGVWLHHIKGFEPLQSIEHKDPRSTVHVFEGKPRVVLWSEHPQARKNAKGMFDALVSGCSEAKEQLDAGKWTDPLQA